MEMETQKQESDFSMRTVKAAMQAKESKMFDFTNANFVELGGMLAMFVRLHPHSLQGKNDAKIKEQMLSEMLHFLEEMPKNIKIEDMKMTPVVIMKPSLLAELKLPIEIRKQVEVRFKFEEPKA